MRTITGNVYKTVHLHLCLPSCGWTTKWTADVAETVYLPLSHEIELRQSNITWVGSGMSFVSRIPAEITAPRHTSPKPKGKFVYCMLSEVKTQKLAHIKAQNHRFVHIPSVQRPSAVVSPRTDVRGPSAAWWPFAHWVPTANAKIETDNVYGMEAPDEWVIQLYMYTKGRSNNTLGISCFLLTENIWWKILTGTAKSLEIKKRRSIHYFG